MFRRLFGMGRSLKADAVHPGSFPAARQDTVPTRVHVEAKVLLLPVEGYPNGSQALREWFRRNYGYEASERELGELQDAIARRDATPPVNDRLPGEPGFE